MSSQYSSAHARKSKLVYSDDYNPVLEYWEKICSGEIIVSRWVKKTFEKLVHDIEHPGEFFYSPKRANHVDTRSGLNWYGDETVTTVYSVTDDFYKHYKLSTTDVYDTSGTINKRTKAVTLTIDGVTYQGTLTEK